MPHVFGHTAIKVQAFKYLIISQQFNSNINLTLSFLLLHHSNIIFNKKKIQTHILFKRTIQILHLNVNV